MNQIPILNRGPLVRVLILVVSFFCPVLPSGTLVMERNDVFIYVLIF